MRPRLAAALMLATASPAAAAPGCDGGLLLPGTAGCVRLGGVARAEGIAGAGRAIAVPASGGRTGAALRAGARVDLDARLPTAAGPARAYISVVAGGLRR